jgi:hypothetical protein
MNSTETCCSCQPRFRRTAVGLSFLAKAMRSTGRWLRTSSARLRNTSRRAASEAVGGDAQPASNKLVKTEKYIVARLTTLVWQRRRQNQLRNRQMKKGRRSNRRPLSQLETTFSVYGFCTSACAIECCRHPGALRRDRRQPCSHGAGSRRCRHGRVRPCQRR